MFRSWYIDGRLYYHKVIDLNHPERGISDIRNVHAMKIKLVREYKLSNLPEPQIRSTHKTYSANEP